MSAWTPNPEALNQLVLILSGTLSSNTSDRLQATQALEKAALEPDFDNYLLHILVDGRQLEPQVRASGGLLIKNDLIKNWSSKTTELRNHILQDIPKGLLDSQSLVRNITGNVITSLFSILGVSNWPNILPNLMELATGAAGTTESQEGAMSALAKICEDSARVLDREYNGQRPLNFMVPRFIELSSSPRGRVRTLALSCLNQILIIKSQSILVNLDDFMARLFQLANDTDPTVRTGVCTAFASILDATPEKMLPHLDGIINYSLHCVNDDDDEVALQACEVLLSVASSELPAEVIRPKLEQMLPILLKNMVYSEMEVFLMEGQDENDDEDVEDRDEDIRPQGAHSKEAHKAGTKAKEATGNGEDDRSDSDYDDDDDDDDDDLDLSPSWTLRKCSAASLDILASKFPLDVLKISLPVIKERIMSEEWPVREAAILALGAIAEGCWEEATPQLPSMIPFLVERLKDPQPRVRLIACWTLGRYSVWVCGEAAAGGACANYFRPTFESILECALDKKKVVQQSACSALADFIENAEPELLGQFIEPLLHHFQLYFSKYQRKNLIILYDTVQTFAEKVGEQIRCNENYIKMLLPPLIEKWQRLSDDDKDLWPLLECMSSVAAALGEAFAPYAVPVYERAVRILSQCIKQEQLANSDASFDAPEKDFVVTSIDLIDGLVQGLANHFEELANSTTESSLSGETLMSLLLTCFDDPVDDVRQSVYALLGDLCIYILEPFVLPHLHEVMVDIGVEITNQTYDSNASCNNAIWSLGELSLRVPSQTMNPYLDNFMKLLVPMLMDTNIDNTVLENTAITIGRFGIHNAQQMGPYLSQILSSWCSFMKFLEENDEKETAFQGMCNIIAANPSAINVTDVGGRNALKSFVDCIASYENPGESLGSAFHMLLQGFKNGLGDPSWESLLSELNPESTGLLSTRYST
ncbi:DEKNAAC102307 [Brettanomyces naardenensis]|uniref:DEKNAAC102307 n=1 Tax=Brettanomyces naardenensis TaxID=13370 RepID=A0A448YKV9_BRENA|nr:DEKNAAC102307 [Brettanomyces naardenensis]